MKNLIIGLTLVMLLLAIALSSTSCNPPDNIQMTVTIDGLEKGEEATLTLSLSPGIDPAEKPLFQQTIRSDGERSLTVEITTSLKDGYYQLLLEAPEKYFREPKGYLFQVYQSQIVNPVGRPVIFSLLPKGGAPDVEALISLSAPKRQLAPPPPFQRSVVPEEAYYLPGEIVEVKLSFTNVSSETITLNPFPPEIQVKPHRQDEVVFSIAAGTQPLEIRPDDTITLEFIWDQKDREGKQVPPGWYNITFKDINVIYETDRRSVTNPRARVLIQDPQRTMEKSLDVNQSQTVNGITVTLERIELTSSGMTVYAFGTLPGYTSPQGDLATSPFMHAFAEYRVDGGVVKQAGFAAKQYLENGTRFIWKRLDPIPSDAQELIFRISSRIRMSFADKPEELVGFWEFNIPLE